MNRYASVLLLNEKEEEEKKVVEIKARSCIVTQQDRYQQRLQRGINSLITITTNRELQPRGVRPGMRTMINLMVALAAHLALHFPFNYRDARVTFASGFHNVDATASGYSKTRLWNHLRTRNLPFCRYRFGRINRLHFVPVFYEIFMRKLGSLSRNFSYTFSTQLSQNKFRSRAIYSRATCRCTKSKGVWNFNGDNWTANIVTSIENHCRDKPRFTNRFRPGGKEKANYRLKIVEKNLKEFRIAQHLQRGTRILVSEIMFVQ